MKKRGGAKATDKQGRGGTLPFRWEQKGCMFGGGMCSASRTWGVVKWNGEEPPPTTISSSRSKILPEDYGILFARSDG